LRAMHAFSAPGHPPCGEHSPRWIASEPAQPFLKTKGGNYGSLLGYVSKEDGRSCSVKARKEGGPFPLSSGCGAPPLKDSFFSETKRESENSFSLPTPKTSYYDLVPKSLHFPSPFEDVTG